MATKRIIKHEPERGPAFRSELTAKDVAAQRFGSGPTFEMTDSPPLSLGVELPADPSATKDWADDDETTAVGPVDDLEPIGRVTPVPSEESPRAREYSESDEEPTLLGPNPEPSEPISAPHGRHRGLPLPHPSAPQDEWKAFQRAVETLERREAFIDAAAIAIYASGWPLKNVFARAEQLWDQRVREGR